MAGTVLLGALLACAPGGADSTSAPPVPVETGSSGEDTSTPLLDFGDQRPRNLLFIGIDTLRRDRIGRWDPEQKGFTPFLDSLLDQSVVLANHRSCSNWTLSSLFCLFTGKSTVALGVEPLSGDDQAAQLPDSLSIAPRWLANAGYRAMAVSGSPYLVPEWLTTDGFESVKYQDRGNPTWASAEWITDRARFSLRDLQDTGQPWYLHLHFMDPHTPFDAPASYLEEVGVGDLPELGFDVTDPASFGLLKARYDDMDPQAQADAYAHVDTHYRADLRYMDDQLQVLWQHFEDMGALDNTLVVFWSDHGEQFWEHGEIHHDRSLFGQENRGMAAFWSRDLSSPQDWTGPTVHQDIFPTILDALEVPGEVPVSGDVLGTRSSGKVRTAFRYSSPDPPRMAADLDGLRLHYAWDGSRALYDASSDPDEVNDLYDVEDPGLAVLWEHLDFEIDQALEFLPHLEPVDRGL